MSSTARPRPAAPPPTEELVLKRNPVERLKREKSPLGILGELPHLIATGYADIAEEDIVRLKWWGLYHDKPKIGTFMLRVKLNAGQATPAQLRAIGEISNAHGKGAGELTTRQTVQLHYLDLPSLPDVFDRVAAARLTTAGACGDAVRNTTGCPLAGVAHDELFDVTPLLDEVARFFYGNPDYSNLPRKQKFSISACRERCNAPEINCISLIGAIRNGENGFGVLVGGGMSSVPRIARELGVWVPYDRGDGRAPRDSRRLERGSQVPGLARQVPPQVHGRRPRARGCPRRGGATARPEARRLHARAASRHRHDPRGHHPPEAGGPVRDRDPGQRRADRR